MVWLPLSNSIWRVVCHFLLLQICFTPLIRAAIPNKTTTTLSDLRQPALWTQDFGDCNGASVLEVSRFDAAVYLDNSTVTFHLQGQALVTGMKTMMFLTVYAYGEQRFVKIFDPCSASNSSFCPSNITEPVQVNGTIPLSSSDINSIPSIAYTIPDFEGQAVLRIFDNATESEIACYSAMITNGYTMSWPAAIGGVMGFTIFIALLASFLSATYGQDVSTTRTHYAHSLSIFVVFATLQHVYFTGALSMNWASVLPAFWSNFAWTAGMINLPSMQNSINNFNGNNFGNTSYLGAASLGNADGTAGGYEIAQIYKRGLHGLGVLTEAIASKWKGSSLERRDFLNASDGFYWYGDPVTPGLPVPGNFTGFPGTLSFENIPASNAFLTGLLWFLILLFLLIVGLSILKGMLEVLVHIKWVHEKRLSMFRQHWIGFTAMVFARTCFIAFFTIMFLSFFQFAYGGSLGMKVVAAVVFAIFFTCISGITFFSVFYRLRDAQRVQDRLHLEARTAWKILPYVGFKTQSSREEERKLAASLFSVPWMYFSTIDFDTEHNEVHRDEPYIFRYGWLVSRYRKSKWWFPTVWLTYDFVRAIFFGAAAGHPSVQVFGLLAVEFIGLITMIKMKPFESTRLNVLMIYLLGLSKVVTVALSSAFHPEFGLTRLTALGIAFVIIAIQSLLIVVMWTLVFVGFFSTYLSVTRHRESLPYVTWIELRTKWFKHMKTAASDQATGPSVPQPIETPSPVPPAFNVSSIRRLTKIHDDDETGYDPRLSRSARDIRSTARPGSVHSSVSYSNLPYGARSNRQSWSRDGSPVDHGSRRVSYSSRTGLHSVGSDPNLRNSYGVVPSNRSSNYGSALPPKRRSRSSTYTSVPVVAEEPPLPSPLSAIVLESLKGKERVMDDEITTSPKDLSPSEGDFACLEEKPHVSYGNAFSD